MKKREISFEYLDKNYEQMLVTGTVFYEQFKDCVGKYLTIDFSKCKFIDESTEKPVKITTDFASQLKGFLETVVI